MLQLRIYTLRSADALQRYAAVHWARHLSTFATFGVTTHGVWTERDGTDRLVALIGYPPGADPDEWPRMSRSSHRRCRPRGRDVTQKIMASPEFAVDMAGFDLGDIVDVQSLLLDPTTYSPLHQQS